MNSGNLHADYSSFHTPIEDTSRQTFSCSDNMNSKIPQDHQVILVYPWFVSPLQTEYSLIKYWMDCCKFSFSFFPVAPPAGQIFHLNSEISLLLKKKKKKLLPFVFPRG